jgi:glycosyltransferase involved in cell wall biosynthesis
MGAALTVSHVERMMLLFRVWEVRNGARPAPSNLMAEAFRAACTPPYLARIADRHGIEPRHGEPIAICAGSDDHGALDIATTWTQAPAQTPSEFLEKVVSGRAAIAGEHGSSVKLAHAVGALLLNGYRADGRAIPEPIGTELTRYFDDPLDGHDRHQRIMAASSALARRLAATARSGALDLDQLPSLGMRLGALVLAGSIEAPFVASVRHHAQTRVDVRNLEAEFFGFRPQLLEPRALVFTDTFEETNGVAGTMRRLSESNRDGVDITVVACGDPGEREGLVTFSPDWSVPIPGYASLDLRIPSFTEVLAYVERQQPDVVHVATPGPVGLCGLAAAKALAIPVVGSYHTEFGPYALHLTRDLVVSEALDRYAEWFYRQCSLVLGPTQMVADALEKKGLAGRTAVWGRGVDSSRFDPARRDESLRDRLLEGDATLVLFVGRVSHEKRVDVLLEAATLLRDDPARARFVIAGDGPQRAELEAAAPDNVVFVGEQQGDELARLYASADLFCFPSTTDTFGQVILEASASALPVVAAAAGGAVELVGDGETGLLVAPGDSAATAEAIRTLLRSPPRRAALGARARGFALECTWARSIDQLSAAYRFAATGDVLGPARVAA